MNLFHVIISLLASSVALAGHITRSADLTLEPVVETPYGYIPDGLPDTDPAPNSCWTAPNGIVSGSAYSPGICHICVNQNGTGLNSWFGAWARDASNFAMEVTPAVNLGPETANESLYTFNAGPEHLTVAIHHNKLPSKASSVSLLLGKPPAPQMSLDPATHENSTSCNAVLDAQDSTETKAQCYFLCEASHAFKGANSRRTQHTASSSSDSRVKEHSSVSHPRSAAVGKGHPAASLNSPPAEKNGVLPDGTVINPNPENNPNATKSPQSCWTKPVEPVVPMAKDSFSPGLCQVCVTQWGFGQAPQYQVWIRDALNHAMGEMDATTLTTLDYNTDDPTSLTIPAGTKSLNIWPLESQGINGSGGVEFYNYSRVYMVWQVPSDFMVETMVFDPGLELGLQGSNCSLSGSTQGGAVTYFQCHFECPTEESIKGNHSSRATHSMKAIRY